MFDFKDVLISPSASFLEAMKIIDKGAAQIALVVDDHRRLLGTLTDGDIRRGLERIPNQDFFALKAVDLMTESPKEITPEASLLDAELMMKEARITSLIVKSGQTLIGLIAKHQIDQLTS